MKKLDLYIIRKFLTTFFFMLASIMLIAIIFDISEKIDEFVRKEVPISEIALNYYLNFILYFGNLFSPLLIFLSVIFFTAKMASQSEIVAILSSGVSFKRMLYPYFIAATLLGSTSFCFNHWIVPKANETRIQFENDYLRRPYRNLNKNIHKQIGENTNIYFSSYNSTKDIGYKFSLENWENGVLKSKIIANFIKWNNETKKWSLQNYMIRSINELEETLEKGVKLDTSLGFTPEEFNKRTTTLIETMNMQQLNEYIEDERLKGNDQLPFFEIVKHQRSSLPLATYILTLIGVSVSSRKVRGGIGAHLALGVGLCFSYILLMKIASVYATNAGVNPLLATWLPNILFAFIAIYIFQKAPK